MAQQFGIPKSKVNIACIDGCHQWIPRSFDYIPGKARQALQ